MRFSCLGVFLIAAFAGAGHASAAANVVGQAVQRLHLSPQQLLSLRDALGDFSRGTQVEASGENQFVLRDASSMAYSGAFSLKVNADGSLQLDRVSGPARLDAAHSINMPLRLNARSRAQVAGMLAGSALLSSGTTSAEGDRELPPSASALPEPSLPAIELTDSKALGSLGSTRAVFYRDGSGWMRMLRAPLGQTGAAPSPMRVADRYLPPLRSDGKQVWRDASIEIDSEVPLRVSDLDNRYRCAPGALCNPRGPVVTPSTVHLIRWGKQMIAAVPPALLAQMVPLPPPNPDAAPQAGDAQPAADSSRAGNPEASPQH